MERKLKIDLKAKEILTLLKEKGFPSYIVGGAVRDLMLNREVHDYDIATPARPVDLQKLFPDSYGGYGEEYGSVTIVYKKQTFEITTLRQEGDYIDYRHPDRVFFTDKLDKDLARRDFTVNAMGYSLDTGLFDPFHGEKDLENNLLVAVGNPHVRFKEDALRILRGLRFASTRGFDIERNTLEGMKEAAPLLLKISKRKKTWELIEAFNGDYPENLSYLTIKEFWVNLFGDNLNKYSLDREVFEVLKEIPPIGYLRLMGFMHLLWKNKVVLYEDPEIFFKKVVDALEIGKQSQKEIIEHSLLVFQETPKDYPGLRRVLMNIMFEDYRDILTIKNVIYNEENDEEKKMVMEIALNKDPIHLKDLKVNGDDLRKIGFEGKMIGKELYRLLELILKEPEKNQKEVLLLIAKKDL